MADGSDIVLSSPENRDRTRSPLMRRQYTFRYVVIPGTECESPMYSNLYKNRCSYINDISSYFSSHKCNKCGKLYKVKKG